MIPVNKDGYRLDPELVPASDSANDELHERCKTRKLCNNFHLKGSCPGDPCEFDHSQIDDDLRLALSNIARSIPCVKKGACRRINCFKGHACQRKNCHGGCRFASSMHYIDPAVAEWVNPDMIPSAGLEAGLQSRGDVQSILEDRSEGVISPGSGVPLENGASIDSCVQSEVEWDANGFGNWESAPSVAPNADPW